MSKAQWEAQSGSDGGYDRSRKDRRTIALTWRLESCVRMKARPSQPDKTSEEDAAGRGILTDSRSRERKAARGESRKTGREKRNERGEERAKARSNATRKNRKSGPLEPGPQKKYGHGDHDDYDWTSACLILTQTGPWRTPRRGFPRLSRRRAATVRRSSPRTADRRPSWSPSRSGRGRPPAPALWPNSFWPRP